MVNGYAGRHNHSRRQRYVGGEVGRERATSIGFT